MVRAGVWAVLAAWVAAFCTFGPVGRGRADQGHGPAGSPRPASFGDSSDLWNDPPPAAPVNSVEASKLADAARAFGPGMMQVGQPRGDSGTAFVVSRRHRLLATNAHVAAIFAESGRMTAVENGTGRMYRVGRVWLHPGYAAARRDGTLLGGLPGGRGASVVSRDVAPDVAVLQLEPGGPDLASEWPLAAVEELRGLTARAVGKLGFSSRIPRAGGKPKVSLATGRVSRDAPFAPSWDVSKRWHLIDASAPMRQGDSGGPVFLDDGRVVAVGAWERSSTDRTRGGRSLGTAAVRVDALSELLSVVLRNLGG